MRHTFKKPWFSAFFSLLLVVSLAGCNEEDPYTRYDRQQRELEEKYIQEYLTLNKITNYTKTTSGLYYVPQQAGTGPKAQMGNTVTMHYIGTYLLNGQKFDSSYDTGVPKIFKVEEGREMKGLVEGVTLLTKDEKATLIIPSRLTNTRDILVFDITMLDIK